MYGTRDVNSLRIDCICATNPHCQSATAIFDIEGLSFPENRFHVDYVVPGSSIGCSTLESLRLSTLECLYSTSDCFSVLMHYVHEIYFYNIEYPSWLDIGSLVYNSTSSQFPPNISMSTILNKTMIERWNSSISYKQFYQSCAPSHCYYSEKIRTKTAFGIILTLISLIGGVSVSLRLVTPHLVKLLINLFSRNDQSQQQQGNL